MVTLDGINAKLNRADEQLSSLNGEVDAFRETQSNLIAKETEPLSPVPPPDAR